jgi:citrate synthase
MAKQRYLTAREAANRLDVKPETIYAYVSRGLIRSEESGFSGRDRRYTAEDVEKLRSRKAGRADPEGVAERALHVGSPVLDSAITLISEDTLYYRGRNVIALAESESIERVASLIWTGKLETLIPEMTATDYELHPASLTDFASRLSDLDPMARLQILLPLVAEHDLSAYDLRPEAVTRTGARIFRSLTRILVGNDIPLTGTAETLARSWQKENQPAASLLDAALILCADHELNTSTFTARCAASVGASPYGVVSAGLASFQGPLHGGACRQSESFLREVRADGSVERVIADRLRRGERIPGFGHVIYREADPRAQFLIDHLDALMPNEPGVEAAREIIACITRELRLPCNIDFALALLTDTLGLPRGSSSALFALGRTVGWIGYAIEQYELKPIIRPRARYTGTIPA